MSCGYAPVSWVTEWPLPVHSHDIYSGIGYWGRTRTLGAHSRLTVAGLAVLAQRTHTEACRSAVRQTRN